MSYVDIDFATDLPASWFEEWSGQISFRSSEPQRDSVEFMESVISKWALYERKDRVVRSAEELIGRLEHEEQGEVLGVFIASASWFQGGVVAGFCQFRRTWCNNLVFDFLGIHPLLLAPKTREMSGLGTALLYRLALLARELHAGRVWAETTSTSAAFYANLFGLPALADLLVVEAEEFCSPLVSAVERMRKLA